MSYRVIKRIVTGNRAVDGAGVHLVRVLGSGTIRDFDPFLMLDAFDSLNPSDYARGFPLHPHRGIETFTYLAKGEIDHKDSLGNHGKIMDGCCQWMTAGGGILHQEMPKASPRMLGLQLWINLPRDKKMVLPKYRDITPGDIPVIEENGVTIRVVTGRYGNIDGATRGEYVDVQFLDVELRPGHAWEMDTIPGHTVFAYILEGSCVCEPGGVLQPARRAILFEDGDNIHLQAGPEGARMVIVSGKPLNEPVAWGGPIVMNTEEELRNAFMELEEGTFIRHG